MKRNVVLVLDADADTAGVVAIALSNGNYDLRFAQTSKNFFHFCRDDFEDVAAIVLDVDPGVHGMAILAALDACENSPPVIVVSALEEHRLAPILRQYGAITCLGKPLSFTQLGRALEQALEPVVAPRCDLWGHVTNCTCSSRTPGNHQNLATAA